MSTRDSIISLAFTRVMPQNLLDRIRDVLSNPNDDESTDESKADRQFILSTYSLRNVESSPVPIVCCKGTPMVSREALTAAHAVAGHGSGWEELAAQLPYAPQDVLKDFVANCYLCTRYALRLIAETSRSFTPPSKDDSENRDQARTTPPRPPSVVESRSSPARPSTPSKGPLFDISSIAGSSRRSSSSPIASTSTARATTPAPVTPIRRSSETIFLPHLSSPGARQSPVYPYSQAILPSYPKPPNISDSSSQIPLSTPVASTSINLGKRRRSDTLSASAGRSDPITPTTPSVKPPPPALALSSVTQPSSSGTRPAPLSIRRYSFINPSVLFVKYLGLPDGWQYYFKSLEDARKSFFDKTAEEAAAIGNSLAPQPGRTLLPRIITDAPSEACIPPLHHSVPESAKLPNEIRRLMILRPQTGQEKEKVVEALLYAPSLPEPFTSFDPPANNRERHPYTEEWKEDMFPEIPPLKPQSVFARDEEKGRIILPTVNERDDPPPAPNPREDLGAHVKIPDLVLAQSGSQVSPTIGRFFVGTPPAALGLSP